MPLKFSPGKKAVPLKSSPEKLVYCRAYRAEEARQKQKKDETNCDLMIAAGQAAKKAFMAVSP